MDAPTPLQRSLLAALAYFDLFDYPLTLAELCRYRYGHEATSDERRAMSDILQALSALTVGEKDGFYFLAGRENIVSVRQRRYRLAEGKFARARRAASVLGCLPSVRMVAVCNSLAISNADEQSDIDLFVVCKPGTLWGTRLLVVGALQLLGLRPKPESHADTFCLSFFLSEDRLDLSPFALQPDDTYLRYWTASLVPLYDAGGVMDGFRAANGWVADLLPGLGTREKGEGRREKGSNPLPSTLYSSPFERAAKRFQMKRFPAEMKAMANMDSRVVISDDALKFHVNDRRAYFEGRFREKLRDLDIMPASREVAKSGRCEAAPISDFATPQLLLSKR